MTIFQQQIVEFESFRWVKPKPADVLDELTQEPAISQTSVLLRGLQNNGVGVDEATFRKVAHTTPDAIPESSATPREGGHDDELAAVCLGLRGVYTLARARQ